VTVANDYFFISHDDHTGRSRLATPVISLGLAASLLSELVISQHLTVYDKDLYPIEAEPPEDPLLHAMVDLVAGRPQDRDLGVWLNFFAAEAIEDVAERLVKYGLMTRAHRRGLRGARVEYRPVDITAAARPAIRLARLLTSGDGVTLPDAALTAVISATGLLGHVLWDGDLHRPGYAHVNSLLATLPPPLGALVRSIEVAVGGVVLTKRS
jgi:hypothetical protein